MGWKACPQTSKLGPFKSRREINAAQIEKPSRCPECQRQKTNENGRDGSRTFKKRITPNHWKVRTLNWLAKINVWWPKMTISAAVASPESMAKRPVVLLSQDKPLSQQCSLMYLSSRNRFVLDRQVGHWARQPP